MTPAKVGDLVTAENVSGLPIGTWVEWTSNYYGRVSATKVAADTWVATPRVGGPVRFNDDGMAGGEPTHITTVPESVATSAKLAWLRESARALLDALNDHENASEEADRIDYHEDHAESVYGAKAALYDALAATTPTDPPAAFHGSIPHDTNGDVK